MMDYFGLEGHTRLKIMLLMLKMHFLGLAPTWLDTDRVPSMFF